MGVKELTMKRVALVTLCLAALAVSCGGSSEVGEAGRTVQEFYGHLNTGNHDAAMELYSSDAQQMLLGDDGQLDEDFLGWVEAETRQGAVQDVEIVSEEVDEAAGAATVRFVVNYTDGVPGRRSVSLSEEDGAWRLGFVDAE
jgi:hypothetical protein